MSETTVVAVEGGVAIVGVVVDLRLVATVDSAKERLRYLNVGQIIRDVNSTYDRRRR